MIQLSSLATDLTVNLPLATVVHNDNRQIKVLIDTRCLSEADKNVLETEDCFYFTFNHTQAPKQVSPRNILTTHDLGEETGLFDDQWLVTFDLNALS